MKDAVNLSEQRLIIELKRGSQKAFDDIYAMYSKRLFAYCLQYTKSVEDAEDIVQDVFVKLWINRENIRQEVTLRSLLFIMSKYSLINAYRSRVNSLLYEDYVATYMGAASENDMNSQLEYDDFVHHVKKILKDLPITQRSVVELSRIEQLNNKEIAEKLSLSEQTVKNQLSLGLKILREKLKEFLTLLWMLYFIN
jgi:RNA polymerase sigma-70 factor (family 1)